MGARHHLAPSTMTSLLLTALFTSSTWLMLLHCKPALAQSVEVNIYGDELAQGWGDYSYFVFPQVLTPAFGEVFGGQASLRAYMAPGGFLSKTILLDDSTKVSVLDIQEAYQWTNIQIPLDETSLEYVLIYSSVTSQLVVIIDELKAIVKLPTFAAPQVKPKRYELKDLPPPDSPEAKDAEVEIVLVGDSITHGWQIPGGFRKFLQPSLLERFPYNIRLVGSRKDNQGSDEFDPNHEGYPGYKVVDIENNIDWLFPKWSNDFSPQIAVLMIGTNDILNSYWTGSVPAQDTILGIPDALIRCVAKIFNHRPKIHVILASIPQLFLDDMSSSSDLTKTLSDQFKNEVLPFFQSRNLSITFSDVNSAVLTKDLVDGVHPSDEGFIHISDLFSDAFEEAVNYAKGIQK